MRKPDDGGPCLVEKPVEQGKRHGLHLGTFTACGSFDFFDRLSGMNRFPDRRALGVVASPFDYATQGELRIAAMKHSPKSPGFSNELCERLPALLREHKHGQLVLFTSRRQMQACFGALPRDLLGQAQVQGLRSRTELLKEHTRRVAAGERAIIFGLQALAKASTCRANCASM